MNKKIIWGIIVLAIAVIGAWLFFSGEKEPAEHPLSDKATGVHYAGKGRHVVEGTIMLPNPCFNLGVDAEVRESFPEQVLLRFTAERTADTCIQVLHEAPFHISFQASDKAVLTAQLNGFPLQLDLEQQVLVDIEPGREFTIAVGEERWVEDLKIILRGIEDDSRCPSDVVCIQAGWVTVQVQAGDEQIRLRLPGNASIPNAAVVGSYIITLVDVKPYPNTKTWKESPGYTATFRVEAHDAKG